MHVFKYYALITPDEEDGGYSVSFPDLSNVFTDGETLVEAVTHAEQVLEGMLEVMIDYNTVFNPPRPVSAITVKEGESLVAIIVEVIPKGTHGDFKQELIDELY